MSKQRPNKQFHAPFAGLKNQRDAARNKPQAKHGGAAPAAGSQAPARPAAEEAPERPQDDGALFLAAMAGTTRLLPRTLASQRSPAAAVRPAQTDDEWALAELQAMVAGSARFRSHASEEEFSGAAPGVSDALLDDLRRGRFAYQACLDLHGMVREEAHRQVGRFIAQARCQRGLRCVLVVTGRGRRSPEGMSVLREILPRWLSRAPIRPHVLAYTTARAVDGGPGAFYVLLRRQGVAPFGQAGGILPG